MPASSCSGMIDGTEVVAVEDLADGDTLHPIQQADG